MLGRPVSTTSTPSLSRLHCDVAAGSAQHVNIALHMLRVDFAIARDRVLRIASCRPAAARRWLRQSPHIRRWPEPPSSSSGIRDTWLRRPLESPANGNFSRFANSAEERIIARQMIRHGSSWTRHFDYGLARIRSDFLMCVVKKIGGTYERLGEVVRIVNDHHHSQTVAMPEQMFCRWWRSRCAGSHCAGSSLP